MTKTKTIRARIAGKMEAIANASEALFNRQNIVFGLIVCAFALYFYRVRELFETKIITPILSKCGNNIAVDVLLLVIFILTIFYFTVLFYKRRKISSGFFIFVLLVAALYIAARTGDRYTFFAFAHVGLPYLYYADWLILFCAGIVILQMRQLTDGVSGPWFSQDAFILDEPITAIEQDLFGRKEFAKKIAKKIQSENTYTSSFAVSIIGSWGSGKTSFLKMIVGRLEKEEGTVIINFEPWKSKSPTEIIKDFFDLLIERLKRHNRRLSVSLKEYAAKLLELDDNAYTKSIKFLSSLPGPGTKSKVDIHADVEKEIQASHKHIIITIDDIDRLDKKEVVEVIRLIRNTANFKRVTYIACFDKSYVLTAVKELNEYSYQHYLEKIFQFEFVLPVFDYSILKEQFLKNTSRSSRTSFYFAGKEVRDEIYDLLYRTDNYGTDFKPLFLKTQRDVIRLSNSFFFELDMLKGEVDVEDLFCVHLLKLKFHKVYELLVDKKEFFFIPQTQLKGDDILRPRLESEINKTHYEISNRQPWNKFGKDDNEDRYVFETYLENNNDVLSLSNADTELLVNFVTALFEENSNYRTRYRSTNEIVYAQSFNKYFSYGVLKNSLSTVDFDKARKGSIDEFYAYLYATVNADKAAPLMDKLFLVKDFEDKKTFNTYWNGLLYFGNLIYDLPFYDVYHRNFASYTKDIFDTPTFTNELADSKNFYIKDFAFTGLPPLSFFEYDYCFKDLNKVFTEAEKTRIGEELFVNIEKAILEKKIPEAPPVLGKTLRLARAVLKNLRVIGPERYDAMALRLSQDFWNNNDPCDYGIVIKEDAANGRTIFTLATSSALLTMFGHAHDIDKIDGILSLAGHKAKDERYTGSKHLEEFIAFLNAFRLKPKGVHFKFEHLAPGEMLTDFSSYRWEVREK